MRILYVSHSFPLSSSPLSNVGGMQRVAVDLHQALDRNPEIELKTLALRTSWRMTGLRTGPFLLGLVRRIPRMVRDERIDVVLFSSMVTASVTPLIARAIREAGAITAAIPVGRDLTLPNPAYQRLVRPVLRSLDLVFPISRATAAAALERGADPGCLHVVPCGVEFPHVPEGAGTPAARARLLAELRSRGLTVADGALILLSVGRHQERKGFHWFVSEVLPKLPASAVYLLAGAGPMTPEIRARVERPGLAGRAHLLGQVPEDLLRALYAGADLFVMPNLPVPGDIEGFGVVMLEAGAAGLPVLASDLEGIRDVITSGENGWLLPPGDAEAYVEAIERLADERERREVGARAARHVRERFGWDAIVVQYLEVLRRTVR